MHDPIERFEITVLRPMWLVLIATAAVGACLGDWALVAGAMAGWFCCTLIGAYLHPMQLSSRLSKITQKSETTFTETLVLAPSERHSRVRRACAYVALLSGAAITAGALLELRWSWLAALSAGYLTALVVNAVLRRTFPLR